LIYGGVKLRLLYPAKDGFVSIAFLFGATIGAGTARLMQVIHERGFCDASTCNKDWIGYAELLTSGVEPLEEFERVKQVVARFTLSMTKDELLQLAVERNLLIAPVSTIEDLLASAQLAARGYFRDIDHPRRDRPLRHPGPFAQFSRSPIIYSRSAPRVDEHGAEIRRQIALAQAGSPRPVFESREGARALEGVKIVDLMWAVAGPTATRVFADHGATIVRLESPTRIDVSRTLRPFRGGKASPEGSALFHTLNVGKQMMTLDLASDAGREVFWDLVRWADVLTESYSPQVMEKLGYSYEKLAGVNPELIVLSTSLMGKTGPLIAFAGYGNMASAWCGFYEVAGWPDRDPAGPWGAYTDFVGARYHAIAVLGALEHRQRTGDGAHIDCRRPRRRSISRAAISTRVNGRVAADGQPRPADVASWCLSRSGLIVDRVAVADDEQWRAFGKSSTVAGVGGSRHGRSAASATRASRRAAGASDGRLVGTGARGASPGCRGPSGAGAGRRRCGSRSAAGSARALHRDPAPRGRNHRHRGDARAAVGIACEPRSRGADARARQRPDPARDPRVRRGASPRS
jgi:crotonobetainyl-CoA:carnitine CoA-transferase CaiB-like acyl-CoA transferase